MRHFYQDQTVTYNDEPAIVKDVWLDTIVLIVPKYRQEGVVVSFKEITVKNDDEKLVTI